MDQRRHKSGRYYNEIQTLERPQKPNRNEHNTIRRGGMGGTRIVAYWDAGTGGGADILWDTDVWDGQDMQEGSH